MLSVADENETAMQKPLAWLLLSIIIIFLDQYTKFWAVENLANSVTIDILPFLDFGLTYNTGAAFSFLANAGGWQKILFSAIAVLVSIYLIYCMSQAKESEKQLVIAYSLVVAGAIGNLIDRLRIDKVVDFIHVFYQNWHFPYFNIADISITIGAILMIMDVFNLKLFR